MIRHLWSYRPAAVLLRFRRLAHLQPAQLAGCPTVPPLTRRRAHRRMQRITRALRAACF